MTYKLNSIMACESKPIFTLSILLFAVTVSLVFSASSCRSPVGPSKSNVQLTAADVECTEIWLKISFVNTTSGGDFAIDRDGTTVISGHFSGTDTTVVDDSVQANKTYNYVAYNMLNGKPSEQSQALQVTTLDTTSNNWTFQTFELGGSQSSVLNDVAIINDTLAYAVGEIYGYDSTGHADLYPYGVARRDGTSWKLIKLLDNAGYPLTPIRGILVVNPNDIWLAAGSVYHWDGVSPQAQLSFSRLTLSDPNATIEKLWGTSSLSLYGVGNAGTIIWYNGTVWQALPSGIDLDINDIWGDYNAETGQGEILAVAADVLVRPGIEVLKINGTSVQMLDTAGINAGNLSSVWFEAGKKYYVAGGGIFQKNSLSNLSWTNGKYDITSYYIYRIRGTSFNSIVAVGGVGEILTYNGASWKSHFDETKLNSGNYNSVATRDNIIVAVGEDAPYGVVTIGRR